MAFVRSNSSVVGAFLVIGGLFLAQRWVGDWLTDASVVDESDIPSPSAVFPPIDDDAAATCDPWLLTFADEFDGDDLDDDRWLVFNSPDRNGNGVRRPEAVTVGDGVLTITARQLDDEIVSGAIASRHQQLYGRIEARVRADADPSESTRAMVLTWPAGNNHPEGGENDLYDTLTSSNRQPFYSYIHHPDETTPEEIVHRTSGEQWHELALEWTPDSTTVLLDGDVAGTVTDADAIASAPHVITVQLVAGSAQMGDEPVAMYVDWIRAYRANESPPSTC